jgi:thiamine-monophosphate kinase
VRNFAQGAIDVSDGLVGDVEKLAHVSRVGAVIEAGKMPLSPAARQAVAHEPELLASLLTAGDDYEIVAAVPETSMSDFEAEAKDKGVPVTAIGRISGSGGEVSVLGPDGQALALDRTGYAHF